MVADDRGVECPGLVVYGADMGNCNGEYRIANYTVSWAPDRPVYQHIEKNMSVL